MALFECELFVAYIDQYFERKSMMPSRRKIGVGTLQLFESAHTLHEAS